MKDDILAKHEEINHTKSYNGRKIIDKMLYSIFESLKRGQKQDYDFVWKSFRTSISYVCVFC